MLFFNFFRREIPMKKDFCPALILCPPDNVTRDGGIAIMDISRPLKSVSGWDVTLQ